MHWIDWSILALFVIILVAIAIYTRQYTKSVADFLVANRCAGRYLLSMSQGISALGAISVIALFQMYYNAGFTATWWVFLREPTMLLIVISGWVIYRYRETRVMTLAQLFEVRYGRPFRVFCGIIAWFAGIINMGIFPAVTARFFIYFCDLPQTYGLFGLQCSTFATIMILELSAALLFTFAGGMIVVAITDFLQAQFCNIAFLIVLIVIFCKFDWGQIVTSLKLAPENASLINPYKTTEADGFNVGFFLMQIMVVMYGYQVWQGRQGYNAAAKNAHEAKMSNIIATWRTQIQELLILMLPICVFTLLHHSDFAGQAQKVMATLNPINDEVIRTQMLVPLGLKQILPVGVVGLFASVMLAAAISTDDTYLHSWGSIFIQDVILPFRKKNLTSKQHIWLLRASIFFVAVFIFCFSLSFRQTEYIIMYFNITGAIYLGGAGTVLVGALYWKRGSTLGAWIAMILGSIFGATGAILPQLWPKIVPMLQNIFPAWEFLKDHPEKFPYNGMHITVFTIMCAIAGYIFGSLWSWFVMKRPAFNMEKMLKRGKFAIEGEHIDKSALPPTGLKAILPSKEFSKSDKFLYYALIIWTFGWFVLFIIVSIWHFVYGTSDSWWINFWSFRVWLTVILGSVTTLWFLIGGFSDIKDMFKMLKKAVRDKHDDGRVGN